MVSINNKIYINKYVYLIITILIPTWNVIFGSMSYALFSDRWSMSEIYEKVRSNSIHFDTDKNIAVDWYGTLTSFLLPVNKYSNFDFVENKIDKVQILKDSKTIKLEKKYICRSNIIRKDGRVYATPCEKIEKPLSRYAVIISKFQIGTTGFFTKKVVDRDRNKAIAISKWSYQRINVFPFFSWSFDLSVTSSYEGSLPINDAQYFELQVICPGAIE